MLADAGFAEPTFHGWTGYFTSTYTQGGLITARKPGVGEAARRDATRRETRETQDTPPETETGVTEGSGSV